MPTVIWTLQGRLPMETKKLHDKYGSIIRLSPNELAFNSAQAWIDVYGHRVGRLDLQKDPIHVGAVDPIPGVQVRQYSNTQSLSMLLTTVLDNLHGRSCKSRPSAQGPFSRLLQAGALEPRRDRKRIRYKANEHLREVREYWRNVGYCEMVQFHRKVDFGVVPALLN